MPKAKLTQAAWATEAYGAHGLGHHVHFLEVDEAVEAGLVALVGEGHVLEQQRHKRNQRWLQLANEDAIGAMIATGIDQSFELLKDFPKFRWYLLPGLMQSRNGHVRQAHDNGKEGIQILILFAAVNWGKCRLASCLLICN